jgi:hypothetical protein
MATIVNCAFRQNSGDGGDALANWGLVDCVNCTFADNDAGGSGAAVYNANLATMTLKNCILWGNGDPAEPEIVDAGTSLTVTYSDVEGGWTGTGNIGDQPGDDPLFADAELRLSASSPCIDAGTSQGAPGKDLEGSPRPGAGTAGYDMGAYEWQSP